MFTNPLRKWATALTLFAVGSGVSAYALFSKKRAGALALQLFSKPRAAKSRLHNQELLALSQAKSLSSGGDTIRYYHWQGDGPRVLLAHGWESNASRWAPLVHALREQGYDILAPDAPAHGQSGGAIFNVALYSDVLKVLCSQYSPNLIIGHSAGGMAAVFMLHRFPEIAPERLVLLSSPSELEHLMDTFRRMVYMSGRTFAGMQEAFYEKYNWRMRDFSIQHFVQALTIPGLLIHDQQDAIVPFEEGLAIHQNWKGSRMVSTEGLGHSLPGERVLEEIIRYVGEKEPF
ncbi:MAG: alpha/beta fold hydrolase [Saprospiraceae bacterium]